MNIFSNRKNLISYTVDTAFDNNFSISIQNGEVVVSAPWYLSKKQIQEAVSEKTNWILTKLNEYEERKNLGYENITLLGKTYSTVVNFKHVKSPEVNLNEFSIEVILPIQYKNTDISKIMSLITNKLYLSIAEQEIDHMLEKARLMLNIAPENFEFQTSKNVLASCLNEKITINPELFKYNKETIEYVIIHEFCHLKYKTHSQAFYKMLKQYVPNYEILSANLHNVQY